MHRGRGSALPRPFLPEGRVFLLATSFGRVSALLLLLPLLAGGCRRAPAPAAAPIAVTDDAGRSVRLARPARRIVALIPSVNEVLVALGAGDRIIARSDYDREPALAALPSIGGGLTPNVEWIAARRPDLVVAWPDERSRAVVGRLEAVGVPVYAARIETLADAYRTTRSLGTLLGLERRADTLVATLEGQLAAVSRRAAALPRPRVLYLIGLDPPEVAAGGTFVDELLRITGGRNVFEELRLWPTVGLEEIVRRDPDVVVLAVFGQGADATARLRGAPGWGALRAVRAGRVVALDPFVANRPGPHAPEVAEALFGALHPARDSVQALTAVWEWGGVGVWATTASPCASRPCGSRPSSDANARNDAAFSHTPTLPHPHSGGSRP